MNITRSTFYHKPKAKICEYETFQDVITRLTHFIGEVYNHRGALQFFRVLNLVKF